MTAPTPTPTLTFDFAGQTAIVTGGTRGIGAAISQGFLAAGANVYATFRANEEAAEAMRAALPPEQAERLRLERVDVASYDEVEAFFEELLAGDIQPTVLVNNAGIRKDAIIGLMTQEQWRDVLDTNLSGTFNATRFGVQAMSRQRYGRIICVTSPSGRHGFAGQANYAASKAGQVALVKSVSKEVATRGITVNAVSPGYVDTALLADLPEEQRNAFTAQVPLRRFGTPAEVAAAVLFLASREAQYITGSVLEVTGGL